MVRHGASPKIKYFKVLLYTGSKAKTRYNFGKDQGLAREWEKEKGNAWIWWKKRRKNSTPKFRALQYASATQAYGEDIFSLWQKAKLLQEIEKR